MKFMVQAGHLLWSACLGVPRILVGLDIDERKESDITTSKGEKLAKELKMDFIECSAQTGKNIDNLCEMAVKATLPEKLEPKSSLVDSIFGKVKSIISTISSNNNNSESNPNIQATPSSQNSSPATLASKFKNLLADNPKNEAPLVVGEPKLVSFKTLFTPPSSTSSSDNNNYKGAPMPIESKNSKSEINPIEEKTQQSLNLFQRNIIEQFECPLTSEVMQNPVINQYGHTFNNSKTLEEDFKQKHRCPCCNGPIAETNFEKAYKPNFLIKSMVNQMLEPGIIDQGNSIIESGMKPSLK